MASPGTPTSRGGAVSTLHLRTIAGLGAASLLCIAVVAFLALRSLTHFTRGQLRIVQDTMASTRTAETLRVTLLAYGRESDLAFLTHDADAEQARGAMEAQLTTRIEQAQRELRATASPWENVADLAGSLIVALLVVAFCAILVGVRRMVFLPLLSLSDGIHRFTQGERTARVEPRGPEEFRQAAMAFNGMLEQLAEQESRQRTFLAGVAHDFSHRGASDRSIAAHGGCLPRRQPDRARPPGSEARSLRPA